MTVIGSGCTRANLTAFGGNQFKLPEQADQLKNYFSVQIFFLKIGSLLGRFVNPILKADVKCFRMSDCYPLAFGAPAMATFAALIIFLCGKSSYVKKPPGENMVIKVSRCVAVRIIRKNEINFEMTSIFLSMQYVKRRVAVDLTQKITGSTMLKISMG